MNVDQLKVSYPIAWEEVKDVLYRELVVSCENPSLPESFKDAVLQIGVTDDRMEQVIELNPRLMFDAFDTLSLYIGVYYVKDGKFKGSIYTESDHIVTIESDNRKEADKQILIQAFGILNQQLTDVDELNESL